jgi:Ca-activated chloride channel homolog
MKSTRTIRLILALSLALSLSLVYQHNGKSDSVMQSVYAQDATKNSQPPHRRPKAPVEEEDQEALNGQASISVAVDLVSLQVLVTDTKGNILTGLKPENFTIYEDNVKQEISHFSPVESAITAVMLVEFSNNISNFIEDVWNAMYTFAASLRKDDWVAVVGYDLRSTILCDFTQNRQKLEDALARFKYPTFWESNLSDALIDALDRTQEIDGKVAIILISTGLDTMSRHTYDDALKKCKQANATVYTISVGQNFRLRYDGYISNMKKMDYLMGDNRLRSFADFTGGTPFFPRFEAELPAIVSSISQMLRSQYSIAYASTNTVKDGKFRKIRVDVQTGLTDVKGKPIKLKVMTRKGYIAKEE